MHKFEKLMEKKMKDKKSHLDENESKAKMSVLQDLKHDMGEMMKDRLHGGLKKVTVASDSPEGIKKGLDKAKQLVGEMSPAEAEHEAPEHEGESEEEMAEHEAAESPEMEEKEQEGEEGEEEMSEEEIDAKIKKLMAMKEKMKKEKEEA